MNASSLLVRHKNGLLILLMFLISRILIVTFGYIGNVVYGDSKSVSEAFCQWDCNWYLTLISVGYDIEPHLHRAQDAANWAFFPLFPMLARALGNLLSMDYLYAAYIVTNTAFLAALFVLYAYCKRTFDERNALFCVFLLAFSPYSFYFAIPYTEAVFILLTLLVFFFATNKQWLLAGLSAALLSATRNIGVMAVFPMLVIMIQKYGIRDLLSFRPGTERALLGILIAPLGLFLYMFFLHQHVGDTLAFKNIMIAWRWRREMGSPLDALFSGFDVSSARSSYYLVITVFGFVLSAYLLHRKRLAESLWLAIAILIPASTSLLSMPRYIFASFPVYVALTLVSEKHEVVRNVMIAILTASLGFLVVAWTNHLAFVV